MSVPSAHSLLLVASTSAGLGVAGTVTRGCDCSSWPLMSLWRGPGAASPRSCSSQISGEPVGRCPGSCQGCLGGLGTPVAAAHGWRGSGYLARVSLWDSPHPAGYSMTFAVTVRGSSPEARGGHVPAMPGVPENGQVQTGCDHLAWGVLSVAVPEEQPKEHLGCSFPIPTRPQPRPIHSLSSVLLHFQNSSPSVLHRFSCPCSTPSSCVGTSMVNFTSSIPVPSPTSSFSSAP